MIVAVGGLFNTSLDWGVDFAWLLIAASAFAYPAEIGALAGVLFGLMLDGMSGGGTLIYTLSYGSMGSAIVILRKTFYLEGLVMGWVAAILGSEILWLFFRLLTKVLILFGYPVRMVGWISPFLLSIVIGYPVVWYLTSMILRKPVEAQRGSGFSLSSRTSI